MLSKSQAGFIKSLHQKKVRKEHGLFLAEGSKTILEFLSSGYVTETLFYTRETFPNLINLSENVKRLEVSAAELSKMSALSSPQDALAVFQVPAATRFLPENFNGVFTLVTDGIQDPGNMGTLIRTADWFGFPQIICSHDTVDVFNPKVVQATMGSLARVRIYYEELGKLILDSSIPVYGAVLNGSSIYTTSFGKEGIVILGNEGNGISQDLTRSITHPVTIPKTGSAESLNVAIAAAIICSEIRRNSL